MPALAPSITPILIGTVFWLALDRLQTIISINVAKKYLRTEDRMIFPDGKIIPFYGLAMKNR